MRILGLDVGEKTIGVAVSDELGITAQGVRTIRRKGIRTDLEALNMIVSEYGVELMVVGVPVSMNGSIGTAAKNVLMFVEKLKQLDIPVTTEDERLTTVMAERMLIEGNVRRDKRKKVVDKVAAALILQGYLDRRAREQRHEA
jgi:putative Holliday junction resolvase